MGIRLFTLFAGIGIAASAQDFKGDWQGTLNAGGAQLRLVLHMAQEADGWKATLDSVDQGANGIPVNKVTASGRDLKLELAAIGGGYEGKLSADGAKLTGTWSQGGNSLPLEFQRKAAGSTAKTVGSDIDGDWGGTLEAGGQKLRLMFHLVTMSDGLHGTLDSLDQGAMGIPITKATRDGKNLTLEIRAVKGKYEGKFSDDLKSLTGTWSQGGGSLPLSLTKGAKMAELKRPQNPVKPYPYREEEVAYDNPAAKGVRLAGTLTLPEGKGPFPAALLITGSGPQDRDESLLGHKPFLVLSDFLTRKGIAVLRVDDRGVGKSTGVFGTATSAGFATDVEAGIAFLKTRPEIDAKKIGLIGHSEGGLIAPMVASRSKDVAWIVMMAGPAVTGADILSVQQAAVAKASGATEEKIAQLAELNRKLYEVVRKEADQTVRLEKLNAIARESGPEAAGGLTLVGSPWFRYFLDYDPRTALAKVSCPVLAINGEKDLQVSAKQNLPEIRKVLTASGNRDFEAVELPGLNHLFQTAKTGSPAEYAQIEETMSPLALNMMADWLLNHNR